MKTSSVVLCFFAVVLSTNAQTPTPFVTDPNTVALWHYDDSLGTLINDASVNAMHGTSYGAIMTTGRFLLGRHFNGTSSYVVIPNRSQLNFGSSQSFTIDVWFKTTQTSVGELIRRGLAPLPGFALRIIEGKVQGCIGNTEVGSPPDELIRITSTQSYNDGVWHLASLERDRSTAKLYLYVDGVQAATPLTDNFPYALSSDRPLTMGCWENQTLPTFYYGAIDEVRISNIARHASVVVSDTLGLWHFDETSGSNVFDSSPHRNSGTAYSTSIVTGRFGYARNFSGSNSYVTIPNPVTGFYNFTSSQSFTVSAWVKTSAAEGIIVRRGLDPIPGFQLSIHLGHAIGRIGNTRGNTWSDTLLTLTSTQLINDNVWHELRMVRDRSQEKLFLYVDGMLAATPQNDNFTIPLTNDRPLTFGASLILPDYFTGPIDEVGIFKGARHPATVTSDTVAYWHYDEASGSNVIDASPYGNNGVAFGTTIVSGRVGNARLFNGTSDYVNIGDPSNGSLDFANGQSFTIQAWFRTTDQDGFILRKGLAPVQGYDLAISSGHVQAEIGNREDGTQPDTVLRIRSTGLYNDGVWHKATFVRDQSQRKVFLYIDDLLATTPLTDPILFSLSNDRPMMMGRWENPTLPTYYNGSIDEVLILRRAQHPQTVVLSDTAAIWPLDETSGSLVRDISVNHNDGTAYGTSIVAGRFGNARQFNGFNDYIWVGDPFNGSLDFANGQSFTIEAWFKTTSMNNQQILRKGLAPVQGYELKTNAGRVEIRVGNREDSRWPDTLLTIRSTNLYNDGDWHKATMVRDQTQRRLLLYVDGILAAPSISDPVQFTLANDRPFTIGRWENSTMPTYFNGTIDDIRIYRSARHGATAPTIQVSPEIVNFGVVPVGNTGTFGLQIANLSFSDTLNVSSISSNRSVFTTTITTTRVPPGASRVIDVRYTPTAAVVDTGSLFISSNDPNRVTVRVRLNGQGFAPSASPLVSSIRDIPEDQGKQVRVSWYRSMYDGITDSLRIVEYNVWRRIGNSGIWDFIATVPAVRFEQYAFVAPTLFDSNRTGIRWSVFRVSAHTAGGAQVFFSASDSGYSVDNLPPLAPTNLVASVLNSRVILGWDLPTDPDIEAFAIYRSTDPNFLPSDQYRIGTTGGNGFVDQNVGGSARFYYYVAAFDTTGNQSAPSNQANVFVTGVGSGSLTPTNFQLYQNYPNPFNPSSTIRYDVPLSGHVRISLYDVVGKKVATLVDDYRTAGSYDITVSADKLSSGVYLYRMQSGTFNAVKKMILMK